MVAFCSFAKIWGYWIHNVNFLNQECKFVENRHRDSQTPWLAYNRYLSRETDMYRTSSRSKTAEINIGATGNPDLQNPYAFESTRSVSHKYRSGSRSFHHHAIKVARTKLRIFPGTGRVAMHTLMSCGCHALSLTMASMSAKIACLASAGPLFNI